MFQLQGAIIRPLYIRTDPYLVFGVGLESKLFTLLKYCCVQCSGLVKHEVKWQTMCSKWSIVLKYTVKLELTVK